MPLLRRLAVAVGLLAAGCATGTSLAVLHPWPPALVGGLVAGLLALVALPPGWWSRLAFGAGWVLAVTVLTLGRPEGDHVLTSDVSSYAVLATTLFVSVVAVATLPGPGRRRPPGAGDRGERPGPT